MAEPESGLRVAIRQSAPIALDADLACGRGEVLALVGPSGSGKSTVLRCIAGLHAPAEGRIECGGETWLDTASGKNLSTARRRIGMVFQNYALFPHLSALENVLEGMDDPRSAEARERARQLLHKVHLDGLERRRPHQLSGGQQQRVAVARALGGSPSILLADEPTGNLDSSNGEAVMELLGELHKGGATICMVTHDPRYAELAGRTVHLFDGRRVENAVEAS